MNPENTDDTLSLLTCYWWLMAVRGAGIAIYGLLTLVWPEITFVVLVSLSGILAIVVGVLSLITGIRSSSSAHRFSAFIMPGLVGIGIGVVAFVMPNLTELALVGLVGVWSVVLGLTELLLAIRLRGSYAHEWTLIIAGILSLIVGAYVLIWPDKILLVAIEQVGIAALIFGSVLAGLAFRLRQACVKT